MSAAKSIRDPLWDIVVESSLLSDAEFVRPAHLRFIVKVICNLWFAQAPRTGQIPAQPLICTGLHHRITRPIIRKRVLSDTGSFLQ